MAGIYMPLAAAAEIMVVPSSTRQESPLMVISTITVSV